MKTENKTETVKEQERYDAWLLWSVTDRCNLNCEYCGNSPEDKKNSKVKMIDIDSLKRSLEKTKKIFNIGFTGGGEPFLTPNLVEACEELTKKHFISLNTNLTSQNIKKFAEKIDPKRVLFIVASLHIKSLEKAGLFNPYIENFLLLKKKGFNVYAQEVAYPPLIQEVEKYKVLLAEKGIILHFARFNGIYHGKNYPRAYSKKELDIFGIESNKIHNIQWKTCNAGYNAAVVSPDGKISPCVQMNAHKSYSLGNIYTEIKFRKIPLICPFKSCSCPLYYYDKYLFSKLHPLVFLECFNQIPYSLIINLECNLKLFCGSLMEKFPPLSRIINRLKRLKR